MLLRISNATWLGLASPWSKPHPDEQDRAMRLWQAIASNGIGASICLTTFASAIVPRVPAWNSRLWSVGA